MNSTDNYKKHTAKNPLQRLLINRFFNTLTNEVKTLHPKTVLDVGCGEGFTLNRLRKNNIGKDLVGIDVLKTAIEIGKKQFPHLNLREGSAYKIPFKNDSFDMVLCLEVLEHLEDPKKALQELVRVSKKYIVISVPNEPTFRLANFIRGKNLRRWGNDIEHINHWSIKGIKKFAMREMRVIDIKKPFPWTIVIGVK